MNDDIKNKVKLKHKLWHCYLRYKRNNEEFAKLEDLCNEIDDLISKSKKECYQNINRKLNDPSTSSKTFWSIMNFFFKSKKVSTIPPLLFNGAFLTHLQKSKYFQFIFCICTLVSNDSVLLSEFTYMTFTWIQ